MRMPSDSFRFIYRYLSGTDIIFTALLLSNLSSVLVIVPFIARAQSLLTPAHINSNRCWKIYKTKVPFRLKSMPESKNLDLLRDDKSMFVLIEALIHYERFEITKSKRST